MTTPTGGHRLTTTRREEERVTPLELFFDLVFVLAITQCTSLIVHEPTWAGISKGLLVLGVLWWGWVGYAWLTSVVDPEEGAVRLAIFAAMAGFLVVALCVPEAFGDLGLTFAIAYGVVRAAHIALFVVASRDDRGLRHSVIGLGISTGISVGLLAIASTVHGWPQGVLWGVALALDMGGPLVIDASGWRLEPGHFAERHGLIIIIALGESIVAIGVGAEVGLDAGIVAAAVLGIGLASAMWWVYFDVVALVSARRLARAEEGRERNELARDSYSYMHFVLVAGVILLAFGLKKVLGHVEDPLKVVPAFGLLGGLALYLLGHVAFRYRHIHTINRQRLGLALLLFALIPVALELPPLVILALMNVLIWGMIVYETRSYGEGRARLRQERLVETPSG